MDNNQPPNDLNAFPSDNELVREVLPPKEKKMNVLVRFGSLIGSPGKLFLNISLYRSYWPAIILCALITLISVPFMSQYTKITLDAESRMSIERYGVDIFGSVTNSSTAAGQAVQSAVNVITPIVSTVSALVQAVIEAALLALILIVCGKMMKLPANYNTYFSIYLHIAVISAIGYVLTVVLGILNDTNVGLLSLASVLMPGGNATQPLFTVLSAVSLPALWTWILAWVGIRAVNGCSWGKALIPVLVVIALLMLFYVGTAYFTVSTYDRLYNTLSKVQTTVQ